MIRVLVIDDSVVARRIITRSLEQAPFIEVVGTAPNGLIGLKKVEMLEPDIVLMDVEMPEMDGLTALTAMKEIQPDLPIIMFSSLTREGAETTLEALELGAADFVEKPTGARGLEESKALIFSSLVPKIRAICRKGQEPVRKYYAPAPRAGVRSGQRIDVVAIGVSTGGPNALAQLIPSLPASFPVPVVVVQHMPPFFTQNLAARLHRNAKLNVQEAADGDVLRPGNVWIAPGGYHIVAEREKGGQVVLHTNQDTPEEECRPAVNVLFRSVAKVYGKNVLSVILTGMGRDGLEGSRAIVKAGGRLFAQDEASAVVWGMPGAVVNAGLPDKILPLNQMGQEIIRCVMQHAPAMVHGR